MTNETKKKSRRWLFMLEQRAKILDAMRVVLSKETHKTTLSDERLAKAIKEMGVWTSASVTREVRLEAGIKSSDERKFELFEKGK